MNLGGQRQEAGDASLNAQAGRDIQVTVNQGVSASDVVAITREMLEENLIKMRGVAETVFSERAYGFLGQLLDRLAREQSVTIQRAAEPDFQLGMLDAAKAFARSGEPNLQYLLIDVLIEKTLTTPRSLVDLVLSESLIVVPKLSPTMIDTVTTFWLLRNVSRSFASSVNEADVFASFDRDLALFTSRWPPSESEIQYLQYLGCGAMATGTSSSFQNVLEIKLHDAGVSGETSVPFRLDEPALLEFPSLGRIRPTWTTASGINQFYLTSLGIAVAHANYRRVTRIDLDLNMWIK